jgi:hypothetical protein
LFVFCNSPAEDTFLSTRARYTVSNRAIPFPPHSMTLRGTKTQSTMRASKRSAATCAPTRRQLLNRPLFLSLFLSIYYMNVETISSTAANFYCLAEFPVSALPCWCCSLGLGTLTPRNNEAGCQSNTLCLISPWNFHRENITYGLILFPPPGLSPRPLFPPAQSWAVTSSGGGQSGRSRNRKGSAHAPAKEHLSPVQVATLRSCSQAADIPIGLHGRP